MPNDQGEVSTWDRYELETWLRRRVPGGGNQIELNSLELAPAIRAKVLSGQTFASGASGAVVLTSTEWETQTNMRNGNLITIPRRGIYAITGWVRWDLTAATAGQAFLAIRQNTFQQCQDNHRFELFGTCLNVAALVSCAPNDIIDLFAFNGDVNPRDILDGALHVAYQQESRR